MFCTNVARKLLSQLQIDLNVKLNGHVHKHTEAGATPLMARIPNGAVVVVVARCGCCLEHRIEAHAIPALARLPALPLGLYEHDVHHRHEVNCYCGHGT